MPNTKCCPSLIAKKMDIIKYTNFLSYIKEVLL